MSLHRVLQRLAREATEHESGTADGHAPVAEAHRVLLSLIREDEASVRAVIDMAEEFDRLRAAGQQTWNASEALLRVCLGGHVTAPVAPASSDLESAAGWLDKAAADGTVDWTFDTHGVAGVQWRVARVGRRVERIASGIDPFATAIIEAAKSLGWGGAK